MQFKSASASFQLKAVADDCNWEIEEIDDPKNEYKIELSNNKG